MKFDIMRCVWQKRKPQYSPAYGTIYLDLWDNETKTGAELQLTFPKNVIDDTYNYFDYLCKTESRVDPVKIMIFHSLVNKEKNNFVEALVKIGGYFD